MPIPADDAIVAAIQQQLVGADLEQLTVKSVRKALEEEFDVDLSSKKDFIKAVITREMQKPEPESDAEAENGVKAEASGDDDHASDSDEQAEEKAEKKKRKSNGAFNAPLQMSEDLYEFMSLYTGEDDAKMSRPQVVKNLWKYIKEKSLQSPTDGRKILLDESLQKVFQCKTMDMFSMNKKLSKHLKSADFLVDGNDSEADTKPAKKKKKAAKRAADSDSGSSSDSEQEEEQPAKKRKKPAAATSKKGKKEDEPKKKPRKKKAKSEDDGEKKKSFGPKYNFSDEMAAIVGIPADYRSEGFKLVWNYIKEKQLQNPKKKSEIICDEKLKAFCEGADSIQHTQVMKFVSSNLRDVIKS